MSAFGSAKTLAEARLAVRKRPSSSSASTGVYAWMRDAPSRPSTSPVPSTSRRRGTLPPIRPAGARATIVPSSSSSRWAVPRGASFSAVSSASRRRSRAANMTLAVPSPVPGTG